MCVSYQDNTHIRTLNSGQRGTVCATLGLLRTAQRDECCLENAKVTTFRQRFLLAEARVKRKRPYGRREDGNKVDMQADAN